MYRTIVFISRLPPPFTLLTRSRTPYSLLSIGLLPIARILIPPIASRISTHVNSFRSFYSSSFVLQSDFKTNAPIVPFLLADIGEGITECEITQWFVKKNDTIEQFDKICEVQSDKAAVEISSRFDGAVTKLHYQVGDMAKVGTPLIDIQLHGHDTTPSQPVPQSPSPPSAPLSPSTSPSSDSTNNPTPKSHSSYAPILDRVIFATPAVRRLAREHHIDLNLVPATGKGDRILKNDVLFFIEKSNSISQSTSSSSSSSSSSSTTPNPAPAPPSPIPPTSSISLSSSHQERPELRPLTLLQKAMFKSMSKSLSIPHFGYSDEIRMDALVGVRETINQSLSSLPGNLYPFTKVSFMPLMIKSFSLALHQFPLLNTQLVVEPSLQPDQSALSAKLRFRSRHNVSIAMDTPAGLIAPNIKDVQEKSILDIATDLHRLQEAGKKNAIAAADLQGGTITLSNIGAIGGTYVSPIIVTSEVCIVALGKSMRVPRFTDPNSDQVEAHLVMPVSLSADHRIVDGATAARFIQLWKQYLESPMSMLSALK